jgi:hypothetical protein
MPVFQVPAAVYRDMLRVPFSVGTKFLEPSKFRTGSLVQVWFKFCQLPVEATNWSRWNLPVTVKGKSSFRSFVVTVLLTAAGLNLNPTRSPLNVPSPAFEPLAGGPVYTPGA